MYNLEKLFKGYISIISENGEYTFERFTKKQFEIIEKEEYAVKKHTRGNANLIMEFVTEKDEISFDFRVVSYLIEKKLANFDIYENDVFYETRRFEEGIEKGTLRYKKRNKGATKITIYFMCSMNLALSNFDLGEVEYVEKKKKNYLALGDSITQGYTSDRPSMSYVSVVARHFDLNCLNLGIGGYNQNPEILDQEINFDADVITIAFGVNDSSCVFREEITFDDLKNFFKGYYDKITEFYPNAKINVITPIWCEMDLVKQRYYEHLVKLREFIKEEAGKRGFNVIDGLKMVPNSFDYYEPDGLHPNAEGFMHYAVNLIKEIKV